MHKGINGLPFAANDMAFTTVNDGRRFLDFAGTESLIYTNLHRRHTAAASGHERGDATFQRPHVHDGRAGREAVRLLRDVGVGGLGVDAGRAA